MKTHNSYNIIFENDPLMDILYNTFEWFLIIGSMISLILGVVLFNNPKVLIRVNHILNQWFSFRKRLKPLEIMRNMDKFAYRKNKLYGWLMIAASLFCLYVYIFNFPIDIFEHSNTSSLQNNFFLTIAIQFLRWFFIIFIAVGIPLWILLISYPDRLKKVSSFFNQWISTRKLFSPLMKRNTIVDSFVLKFHKSFALLFIVGSVFILYTFV